MKHNNAAQALQDSVQTLDYLRAYSPLQGLRFQVVKPESEGKGQPVIKATKNYREAIRVLDSLNDFSQKKGSIQFYIFNQISSFPEVQEYVNLLRKNELVTEKADQNFDNSLILEANRIPFQPFYKLKSKIFNDIKFVFLIGIMALFFVTFIVLLFFLVVVRAKNVRKNTQTKKFQRMCQSPLSFLLMESSMEEMEEMDFLNMSKLFPAQHFPKKLFKETLLKEIISLNKNLKGEFKDRLKLIYNCLNLNHLTINKLKSRKWDTLSSGIVESNEMDVIAAIPYIEPLASNKNHIVRTNAVIALLNLSPNKDLQFLAKQKYPLSKWQQMSIYRVIKYIATEEKIDLIPLLESKNNTVRVFGIRLVRYLGKFEIIPHLSRMFFQSTEEEKQEILSTIKSLSAFTEVELVNEAFLTQSKEIAIIAADVLKDIGNEDSVQLMVNRLKEGNLGFELTKTILTGLLALAPDKFEEFTENMPFKEVIAIRDHLKDPMFDYV
ncbi:hypothetical protein ACFFUR_09440 [Echinicola jeungdonensis]|uniref:HEAT repeat-containing protein n=2 Tax=Echinicola jeungdonensis TaxID=709343 RepID=A0ABV5J5C7_9BACT